MKLAAMEKPKEKHGNNQQTHRHVHPHAEAKTSHTGTNTPKSAPSRWGWQPCWPTYSKRTVQLWVMFACYQAGALWQTVRRKENCHRSTECLPLFHWKILIFRKRPPVLIEHVLTVPVFCCWCPNPQLRPGASGCLPGLAFLHGPFCSPRSPATRGKTGRSAQVFAAQGGTHRYFWFVIRRTPPSSNKGRKKQQTKLFVAENDPYGVPFSTPKFPPKKLMRVPFLRSFPGNETQKLFFWGPKRGGFGEGAKKSMLKKFMLFFCPLFLAQK